MGSTAETSGRKPWIMNAFAMTAPGHLAPGTSQNIAAIGAQFFSLSKFKDSGGIRTKKSRRLTTGFAWPNFWTTMASTAFSSPTCWASTTCTRVMVRPFSRELRFQFLISACSCLPWRTPPRTSPSASRLPRLTRTLTLWHASSLHLTTSQMGGSGGISSRAI